MTAASLRTVGLGMQFQGLSALTDVSLDVPAGQIHGVIGPNGAGKTTLFNCLTGFYRPTAGEVFLGDTRLGGLKPHEISAAGVTRTFQNIRLFGNMTTVENVLVAGQSHARERRQPSPDAPGRTISIAVYDTGIPRTGNPAVDELRRIPGIPRAFWGALSEVSSAVFRPPSAIRGEAALVGRAVDLLRFVGLDARRNEIARNLPYGAQRRLEIARALATRPRLLLLDEPTAGMNPAEALSMVSLIREVRERFDTTILLIEHQMRVVMGVCERITVLDYGRVVADGTPAEVQNNPRVIEAYLGAPAADEAR